MSDNILTKSVSKTQNSTFNFFVIQLDETMDVANLKVMKTIYSGICP